MYSLDFEDEYSEVEELALVVHTAMYDGVFEPTSTVNDLIPLVREYLNSEDKDIITVRTETGRVIGMLACVVGYTNTFRLDKLTSTQTMWWVHPDYRDGKAALMLFNAFERWASGSDDVVFGHYCNDIGNSLQKFLKRKGYKPVEMMHYKSKET